MITRMTDGGNDADGEHLTERQLLDGLHDIQDQEGLFVLVAGMFHHGVALEARVAELEARVVDLERRLAATQQV
jgi:uncharacterized protein YceH (UPF0502 family)